MSKVVLKEHEKTRRDFSTLSKLQTIGEDFCGLDVNTPLGGEDPIAAFPVLTFDTLLTAVAATSTGDYTVVFLGTNKGHLKKIIVNRKMEIEMEMEMEMEIHSNVFGRTSQKEKSDSHTSFDIAIR
ncbi:plexin-A4-like isoform X1 [Vespula maculifrons]|uniref:Plexin-A4-like isoform X1 n=1 Tax=Vespula maculifrons TaxID=7453 RepID=A0ABD2BLC3_VESMC